MKDIENMSDHELLMELVEAKRKEDKKNQIRMILYLILALAILILLGILLSKVMEVISKYNEITSQIEQMKENVSQTFNIFSEEDVETFKKVMEDLKGILNFFNKG